jgi:hypothetical protein
VGAPKFVAFQSLSKLSSEHLVSNSENLHGEHGTDPPSFAEAPLQSLMSAVYYTFAAPNTISRNPLKLAGRNRSARICRMMFSPRSDISVSIFGRMRAGSLFGSFGNTVLL